MLTQGVSTGWSRGEERIPAAPRCTPSSPACLRTGMARAPYSIGTYLDRGLARDHPPTPPPPFPGPSPSTHVQLIGSQGRCGKADGKLTRQPRVEADECAAGLKRGHDLRRNSTCVGSRNGHHMVSNLCASRHMPVPNRGAKVHCALILPLPRNARFYIPHSNCHVQDRQSIPRCT